jgi:cytidyltransferase-like protein
MNDTVPASVASPSRYKPGTPNSLLARARRILRGTASFEERYIPDHDELIAVVETLRSMGCKVVLMTGVWDLFHIGHARYMERGKKEAMQHYPDVEQIIMVVGVDTDDLVKQRKKPNRPFVPEVDRVAMLEHIRWVDIITAEKNRGEMPTIIPHDVRVISESSKDVKNIEKHKSFCEHLVMLPPQSESSTTAMARRLLFDGKLVALTRLREGLEKLLQEVQNADDEA